MSLLFIFAKFFTSIYTSFGYKYKQCNIVILIFSAYLSPTEITYISIALQVLYIFQHIVHPDHIFKITVPILSTH